MTLVLLDMGGDVCSLLSAHPNDSSDQTAPEQCGRIDLDVDVE